MGEPGHTGSRCGEIALRIERERPDRIEHANGVAAALRAELEVAGIPAQVTTRIKSACSARDKMQRKGIGLESLDDICGVRVLVTSVAECYQVLERAYARWPHVAEAFDDYIASPKANGYQSLHAVLVLPCGHTLELQIRTYEQDRIAESGPAAHWLYKTEPGDGASNASGSG